MYSALLNKKSLTLLFLAVISSLLFEYLIAHQTHTLINSEQWHSLKYLKTKNFLSLPEAETFMLERIALANDKLHLSKLNGYHSVLYNEELSGLIKLKIDFEFGSSNSHFLVYFACNENKCLAFRASANSDLTSGLFKIDQNGKFLEIKLIENFEFKSRHSLTIELKNSQVFAQIDNAEPIQLDFKPQNYPLILSSGLADVDIKKIEVKNSAEEAKTITFAPRYSLGRTVWIFGSLTWLLFLLNYLSRKRETKDMGLPLANTLVFIAFTLVLFDSFYWSRQYRSTSTIEKYRKNIFESDDSRSKAKNNMLGPNWYLSLYKPAQQSNNEIHIDDLQLINATEQVEFSNAVDKLKKKIDIKKIKFAFLGGTQTWGLGADSPSQTWPSLVIKSFNQIKQKSAVGINFSRPDMSVLNLMPQLEKIKDFAPNLLIINFRTSDTQIDENRYKQELENSLNFITNNHIKTLIAIEANNPELNGDENPQVQFIREAARKHSISLINLQDYLSKPEVAVQGLLWQDRIHFTNFGHQIVADFFMKSNEMQELLKK